MTQPRISGSALIYGSLAGWGLSAAPSLVLNLILAHYYLGRGILLADVQPTMLASASVIGMFAAISLLASGFGGWSAARLAGRDALRHGAWTGILYLGTGMLAFASPFPNVMPTWHVVTTAALTLPLALPGSWMADHVRPEPYPALG